MNPTTDAPPPPIKKKLSEIRRNEWIIYRWHEVTEVGDSEPVFLRGMFRNPDDAEQAARNWDIMSANMHAIFPNE
jgi:hypothetical protein